VTEFSHDGADDGFHEIQLSGKQLLFLFMATTVVSVVIFICGVLVGKNIQGDLLSAAAPLAASAATPSDTESSSPPPPTASSSVEEPAAGAGSGLTYPDRLGGEKRVPDVLKPVGESRQAPAPPAPDPAPEPLAETPATATPPVPAPTVAPAVAEPVAASRAGTWAVQVVALSDRSAANAVVKRLVGKGFPAFLVAPQAGASLQAYKVQIGRFNDRAEAEQMKNRLKKEEQFEPIVLR